MAPLSDPRLKMTERGSSLDWDMGMVWGMIVGTGKGMGRRLVGTVVLL